MEQKYEGFSVKVRILHMLLFELLGLIVFIPIAALILNKDLTHVGVVGVLISLSAMLWNFIYNWIVDIIEFRLGGNRFARGILFRCLHALLFELGLLIVTVPMVAHFLDMTVLDAFLVDIGFVVFFLIYAFIFNWCFDKCYLYLKKK